jgi:hypothetical protein
MRDHRDHVLVPAEIHAAERGLGGDLEAGVAEELGVTADAYRSYRQVCEVIDRYGDRQLDAPTEPQGIELPLGGEERIALRRTADMIVEAGLDLYSRSASRIVRRPDEITAAARLVLTSGLTLKAQLDELGPVLSAGTHVPHREGERR